MGNKALPFNYNDGGRSKYYKAKDVRDCVTRAIAIVTGKDYKDVYDYLKNLTGRTPRNGVQKKYSKVALKNLGGEWHPTMGIGTGCTTHLREGELPSKGKLVCQMGHHLTTVIDGVVNDTFDPGSDRCVYGYWVFK